MLSPLQNAKPNNLKKMNLLIDENDLKAAVPVVESFGFEKIQPDVRRAQIRLIKTILGNDLTSSLAASYAGGTSDANQKELLEYVHPAIGNLAMWLYADKGNVVFSNNGAQAFHDNNKKPATEWQFENTKAAYMNSGLDALEDMIEFLEDNTGIYSWNTQNTRELLIPTALVFQQYVDIKASRLMFLSTIPIIRRVEKDQVRGTLSKELFDSLKTQILTDGEPSETNQELMDNIRGAIAHFSYADLLIEKSMISDDQGFHLLNNSISGNVKSVTPAEQSRLRIRRDHHIAQANKYLQNLADYLYENADEYPLYKASDLYVEGEQPSDQLDNDEDSPIFTLGI